MNSCGPRLHAAAPPRAALAPRRCISARREIDGGESAPSGNSGEGSRPAPSRSPGPRQKPPSKRPPSTPRCSRRARGAECKPQAHTERHYPRGPRGGFDSGRGESLHHGEQVTLVRIGPLYELMATRRARAVSQRRAACARLSCMSARAVFAGTRVEPRRRLSLSAAPAARAPIMLFSTQEVWR
jgi:hypothetical protein